MLGMMRGREDTQEYKEMLADIERKEIQEISEEQEAKADLMRKEGVA